jgi:hypothetical protein
MKLATISLLAGSAAAFPALLNLNGKDPLLDLSVLTKKGAILDLSKLSGKLSVTEHNQQQSKANSWPATDPSKCPYNKDHKPAAKWNSAFPYTHAQGGLLGNGKGGIQVPAPGDDDHKFIHPGPNDIRGP